MGRIGAARSAYPGIGDGPIYLDQCSSEIAATPRVGDPRNEVTPGRHRLDQLSPRKQYVEGSGAHSMRETRGSDTEMKREQRPVCSDRNA